MREPTKEEQYREALRRLQHMATQAVGMTRAEVLQEVKRVTAQALRMEEA